MIENINASALRAAVRSYGEEVQRRSAENLQRAVKRAAPVHQPDGRDPRPRAGGALRDSITLGPTRWMPASQTWESELFTDRDYASFQDKGTKGPYTILPRRGGFLVFFWPRAGRVVFRRRVRHPGIRRPSRFWSKNVTTAGWQRMVGTVASRVSNRA